MALGAAYMTAGRLMRICLRLYSRSSWSSRFKRNRKEAVHCARRDVTLRHASIVTETCRRWLNPARSTCSIPSSCRDPLVPDFDLYTPHMELKGIRVVVEARNVALPEYEVKMQDSSAVCFVPSKAGAVSGIFPNMWRMATQNVAQHRQNFQVTVYNSSRRPVEFRVYLDGSFAQNFLAHTGKHATMKGMQVDRETMRLFEFTVLNLTGVSMFVLCG